MILSKILKATPHYEERTKETEVLEIWPQAVGERISKHCWPVRFVEKGILLVGSDSHSWLHQLQYLEIQILDKLEKELGERRVKKLKFRLENSKPPSER